VEALPLVA